METLVLPVPMLRRLLRQVIDRPADRCFVTAGVRMTDGGRNWLVRGVHDTEPSIRTQAFEVRLTQTWHSGWLPRPEEMPAGRGGLILLGAGPSRGRFAAVVADRHRRTPVDRLALVGPGMHTFDLRAVRNTRALITAAEASAANAERDRWSRTIGALGEDAWRRLIDLRIVVVGAGRTGSVVAGSLVAMGVRQVTLVDPDVVELHNLGEADAMRREDVGAPKAVAVSRRLRRASYDHDGVVDAVVASLWTPRGIEAAKGADVIFSCVDRDTPRLAAALIATAHHRVLVDLGTGVLSRSPDVVARQGRSLLMGADVRVILPGEGCLLCRGGLTDYDGAVRALAGVPVTSAAGAAFDRRLGSLRSLNLVAAGAALRLFEGVVTGVGRGGWMHLEDDGAGQFEITYPREAGEPASDVVATCPLCLRAGLGDALV